MFLRAYAFFDWKKCLHFTQEMQRAEKCFPEAHVPGNDKISIYSVTCR